MVVRGSKDGGGVPRARRRTSPVRRRRRMLVRGSCTSPGSRLDSWPRGGKAPAALGPSQGEPRGPAKERRLQHAVTQAEGGRAAQDRELGKRPLPLVAQAVAVGALLLAEGLQLGALDLEPVALAQPVLSLRAQPLTLDAKLLALDEEVVGRPLGLGDLLLQERPEPLQVDGGGTRVLRILA